MVEIHSTVRHIQVAGADLGTAGRLKIALISSLVVIDTIWIAASDFEFDLRSLAKVAAVTIALVAISWFYRVKRPIRQFETLCTETAFLLAFSASAAVFSVLMTSIGLPLVDDRLMAIDAELGFDWLAYVGFVNDRPWLGVASSLVYVTTISQVALTVVAVGMLGHLQRVQRFVLSVMFGALICIVISALLPAAGALGTIRPSPDFIAANNPVVDLEYKQAFFDLRDGLGRLISLDEPRGLIAFPSYHSTLSVLVVLAFVGAGRWFWLVLALNLAVIFSTPVDGGHHLVDVIGGIAVAFAAWALAGRFFAVRTFIRAGS
ncbi:phosphatase PAP2 family protein [Mesorhizobium sp. CC13]|uniref:phosphatase PAP2 family protein n=1 Tax=Mesorhizobium sp. CC13 TaxID=3029194 RepID=UPI0032632AF5